MPTRVANPEARRAWATSVSADFAATEAQLHTRRSALRKELGFQDPVLASVLLVVIPDVFVTAVKAGPANVLPLALRHSSVLRSASSCRGPSESTEDRKSVV